MPEFPPLLVAGVGPLPPDQPDKLFAPGLRVWGMARELARAGHRVRLATVRFTGGPIEAVEIRDLAPDAGGVGNAGGAGDAGIAGAAGFTSTAIRFAPLPPAGPDPDEPGRIAAVLAREAAEFGAAALIGCTDLIGRELAAIPTAPPMWIDYFGDPMAERQMLARLHDSDAALAGQWRTLAPALARADRVSGCSRRQVGALLGELAVVGRLNRFTADLDLAHLLEPWVEPIAPDDSPGPALRGAAVPADAFIALQTGGFNTWLDVETLFAALELAMASAPELHFAATGGAIPGHNELSFGRFRALVMGSPYQDRFHFLGWLPLGRIPRVIAEADVGLNVDLPGAEGWLGTRNRLMDWLLGGLTVVTTRGCELAEDLEARFGADGCVLIAPQRDAAAVVDLLDRARRDRPRARAAASVTRAALMAERSAERMLRPLLEWARDPMAAPDLVAWRADAGSGGGADADAGRGGAEPSSLWLGAAEGAALQARLDAAREELARAGTRLDALEGSRLVRAAMRLRDAIGGGR